MTNPEIVDTLDDIAVAIWTYDKDPRYPSYEGSTRKHYRQMARVAVRAMAAPPWSMLRHNVRYLKGFGAPKTECLRQAYQGILAAIIREDLYEEGSKLENKK